MNVLTILRSVEELLYEVISWLLFYPLTLWKTLRRPLTTMEYSDREQRDKPEKQYLETLSPPLFLVLSILLAHAVEIGVGLGEGEARSVLGRFLLQNEQMLLGFRALIFSLPGLIFAWLALKLNRKRIDRESLRAPFFAQCYLSGTTAILTSLGSSGIRYPSEAATLAGLFVILAITVWYLTVQWRWLRQETSAGPVLALGLTGLAFAGSMTIVAVVGLLTQ
jgi:hypothetical protein